MFSNRLSMSRVNILIVEDEPLVAEDIAGHLEFLGFGVASIVHSGEEAVEYLKSNKPKWRGACDDINRASRLQIRKQRVIPWIQ